MHTSIKSSSAITLAILSTLSVVSVTASANSSNNSSINTATNMLAQGTPYVGVKAGAYNIDVKDLKVDIDNPIAYGLYGGYQFNNQIGLEADYTLSDNMDVELENNGVVSDSLKGSSMGVYATYRYSTPQLSGLYLKGKLGVAQSKVETNINDIKTEFKESGFAAGAGVGFDLNQNFAIEAEYNYLPEVSHDKSKADSSLMSIGAHYKF